MANKTIALEASDTSISTATISIKVVQVGKKQLTQSTFKQLEPTRLVDETRVALTGVPWGHVRYFWGDQQERHPVTHFLVQDGATLKRALFWIRDIEDLGGPESKGPLPSGYATLARRLGALCIALDYCVILEQIGDEGYVQGSDYSSLQNFTSTVDGVGVFRHCPQPRDPIEPGVFAEFIKSTPWSVLNRNSCSISYERILNEQREKMKGLMESEIVATVGWDAACNEIAEEIEGAKAQMISYRRRWNELMEKLRTVEQLFIAT